MLHTGAGAHELDATFVHGAAVAHGVFVFQCAFQHVGEDFEVLMGMHGEAAIGADPVIVDDPQIVEVHVIAVKIAGEAEGVGGFQPTCIGMAALVGRANSQFQIGCCNRHGALLIS